MNEYIIYTTEGETIAPNTNVEVENCQVLGRANGMNEEEAKKNLLDENKWIANAGFSPKKFIIEKIALH